MNIQEIIKRLESVYNPEHDLIPGGVYVTATDEQLLQCIKYLVERVEQLERQIRDLAARLPDDGTGSYGEYKHRYQPGSIDHAPGH